MLGEFTLTTEEKERLARFIGTPEWRILEGFFQRMLDDVNTLSNLGKSDKISIEQEVVAKQQLHASLTKTLKDIGFFAQTKLSKGPRRDTSE